MFEFLGVPEHGFIEALETCATDAEVWEWVSEHMTTRSPEENEEFNDWMSSASPDTGDHTWKWFSGAARGVGQRSPVRHKNGISTGSIWTKGARCPSADVTAADPPTDEVISKVFGHAEP